MITTLIALLTSGAGGGIVGMVGGIFKQGQERKERVSMAEIEAKRDAMEYENAKAERSHALVLLEAGAQLEIEKAQTEGDIEVELANQQSLGEAQEIFATLKTTSGMDNFRASVRPVLAYWWSVLFTVLIGWAFVVYGDTITTETGGQLLLGMFATLEFLTTSIGAFYFVSRRNTSPRL
jgi:hypothetical protein